MDYITAIICTIVIYSCLKYFINLIWPKIPEGAGIHLSYLTVVNKALMEKQEYENSKSEKFEFKTYFRVEPKENEIADRTVLTLDSFIPLSLGTRFIYGVDYNNFIFVISLTENYNSKIFFLLLFLVFVVKVKGTKSIINPEVLK